MRIRHGMAWFTAPRGIELLGCLCTNLNCKARNTPVDKTGVNFTDCSQGVLRTVDAPSLLFRLNRALELIRCCEKELCEIQTINNLLTTLNPVKLCFDTKRPYFGWLVVQNRGHSGSRYIYVYTDVLQGAPSGSTTGSAQV